MLLILMLACAGGAIFLIGAGVFSEFHDLWVHPNHRISEDHSAWGRPKLK